MGTQAHPPTAADSEAQVIGPLLVDPSRLPSVAKLLRATDFSDPAHRATFSVLAMMHRAGEPVDIITVKRRLADHPEFSRNGGDAAAYLAESGLGLQFVGNCERHAAIVAEASRKRALFAIASDAATRSTNGEPVDGVLADLLAGVDDLRRDAVPKNRFSALSAAELDAGDFSVMWLVDWLLVEGMPAILAGGKKSLKTTALVDLGLSIATGGEFLGKFTCRNAKRYLLCSGESGMPALQETSRRIARAKGWELADVPNFAISADLPRLDDLSDLENWQSFVEGQGAEVVAVDPAYLCMPGDNADNLFKTGALLANVARVCRDLGVTLILAHHTKKTRGAELAAFDPPELEDIAWAGFQEFARQWLLLGRRERYEPGTGRHRLWLNYGGSTGHSGLLAVNVNEGVISDPGGRFYEVSTCKASEARPDADERREAAKASKAAQQLERDRGTLCKVLAGLPGEHGTKTDIKNRSGLNPPRFNAALAAAIEAGDMFPADVTKANKQTYEGFKLAHPDSPGLTQEDTT
ncbi:MAG TPA: AAA family ATPase [Lacipirellulaceae bacterium]|nr:AAA family ATPase [Lacipirellulaceae bacterium]